MTYRDLRKAAETVDVETCEVHRAYLDDCCAPYVDISEEPRDGMWFWVKSNDEWIWEGFLSKERRAALNSRVKREGHWALSVMAIDDCGYVTWQKPTRTVQ